MGELGEYLISDIRRIVKRVDAFGHGIYVWTMNVELVFRVKILVEIGKLKRLLIFRDSIFEPSLHNTFPEIFALKSV